MQHARTPHHSDITSFAGDYRIGYQLLTVAFIVLVTIYGLAAAGIAS